ncbi:MAG: NAD(P)H-dependent oxidoreductase [Erysipelotrichaceae bacterium]|nr:NAD(P)H-dependent oxidoreductase [Erysipelotrichaceae bacterium]
MKIVMIVGSLRKESFNRQLAEKAAELLKEKAEVSFLDYSDVPFMNQDREVPVPEVIARVRKKVLSADGLWFFSPEYNHSYTGVLKNLTDWLSRPLEPGNYASGTAIAGKKAAISGAAGKSGASYSRERLCELLKQIKADVLPEQTGVVLGAESWQTNQLVLTEEDQKQLQKQAEAFVAFVKGE